MVLQESGWRIVRHRIVEKDMSRYVTLDWLVLVLAELLAGLVVSRFDAYLLTLVRYCRKIATSPSSHIESEQSIKLEKTVVVSEDDVSWNEDNVSWASQKMRDQLDHLGSKDASYHDPKGTLGVAKAGVVVQGVQQCSIVEQREVKERREVDRIDAPGLADPNCTISKERSRIAPPCGSHPP